jgi:predicted Zn-dependent protease
MSIRRAITSRTLSTLPASTDAIITREKQTREISISLTPDEAKQIAERTLYNAWVERNQYKFSVPPKWLRLDPADVLTVNLDDDVSLKLRLNKVDFGGNNVVSCEAVAEDEIVYISNSTGSVAAICHPCRLAWSGPSAVIPHGFAYAAI